MKSGAINLPERDYYSVEKLADLWGCDVELIEHYIDHQKSIRFGIIWQDIINRTSITTAVIGFNDDNSYLFSYLVNLVKKQIVEFGRIPDAIEISIKDLREEKKRYFGSITLPYAYKEEPFSNYPEYIYEDRNNLTEFIISNAPGKDDDKFQFYVSALDFYGHCIFLIDADYKLQNLVLRPIRNTKYKSIPREEKERFEKENRIAFIPGGTKIIPNRLAGEKRTSKQSKRELVLGGYLTGVGYEENTELEDTQQQLWEKLAKAAPELFPPAAEDTIRQFFKDQNFCKFKTGRRKGV